MKTPAEEVAVVLTPLIFTPPPQDPIELVSLRDLEFLDRVEAEAEKVQVFDAASYEDLGKKTKTITASINLLKKAKTEKRKPFTSLADEISDGIDPVIKRFEAVKVSFLEKATKYAQEQEAKAREAERQARIAQEAAEKAQREAEEKARKEQLAIHEKKLADEKARLEKIAADAIASGDEDPFGDTIFTGEEATPSEAPPPPPPPAPRPAAAAPMIAKPAKVKTKGLRTMKTPRFNILDQSKVPREYLMVNEPAVRDAVKRGILRPDNDDGKLTVIDDWIEVEVVTEVVGGA